MSKEVKMSNKQQQIIDKLQEVFDLIKEDDNMSLYIHLVEHVDDMYHTIENIKGKEEDIFYSMVSSINDDKPSATKNLFTNYFNYALTKAKGMLPGDDKKPVMKPLKSEGDA